MKINNNLKGKNNIARKKGIKIIILKEDRIGKERNIAINNYYHIKKKMAKKITSEWKQLKLGRRKIHV